jgi:hypothetical protein
MRPRRVLSAAILVLGAGCGTDADRAAEGAQEDARAAAGVSSDPLTHDQILPGLGVTGPATLPGVEGAAGLVPAADQDVARFLDALTAHCTPYPEPTADDAAAPLRAAFPGRTTLNTLSNPAPFEGAVLRMVLDQCDGDIVPVPFLVDEDRSRTWVLEFTDEGLRLAHDHRGPEGAPAEANLYGGVAHLPASDLPEDEVALYFPADARTVEDRPTRIANVWAMALGDDGRRFFYRLYLDGELRLEAAFDLTVSVPVEDAGEAG